MSVSNAVLAADTAQPKAQVALSESPIYELRDLQVETTVDGLLISGTVDSFYHKQLAQEAVRAVVGKVPMINRIQVRS
jgi:osmotically-inducible protein OsmY